LTDAPPAAGRSPAPSLGDAALAAWLSGRRVVLAYGLLGDATARLRPLGVDYMGAQQDWLRAVGARPEVVRAPTAAPVAANAARIRSALLAGEDGASPALLLAHSKGGLEALAALTDPAAAGRCAAFIAFQSPFRGTPVADMVAGRRVLHGLALAWLRLLGCGDGAGVRDLTTGARRAWMREHEAAVAALAARLPVVTAATVLDAAAAGRAGGGGGRDRAYAAAVRLLEREAGPNDGLVPLASALLPGARHMVEPGGHVALVAAGGGRDPVGALRRALALALAPAA
jgi:hypothetical protein